MAQLYLGDEEFCCQTCIIYYTRHVSLQIYIMLGSWARFICYDNDAKSLVEVCTSFGRYITNDGFDTICSLLFCLSFIRLHLPLSAWRKLKNEVIRIGKGFVLPKSIHSNQCWVPYQVNIKFLNLVRPYNFLIYAENCKICWEKFLHLGMKVLIT